MVNTRVWFLSAALILSTDWVEAQTAGTKPAGGEPVKNGQVTVTATASASSTAAKGEEKPRTSSDESLVTTEHRLSISGQEFDYTATAGLMPIRDARGETEARIFFMAYTRRATGDLSKRPLLFSFNGGPGSASVWLHMGALGPRRVSLPAEPTIPSPPFKLIDNDSSWLDVADLVFIDPIGTGLSRAVKPELNAKFHSVSGDIASVGEFIRLYLTRTNRWQSPLYLIGESYGTTRACGLAGHLVEQGIAFNGIVLVSCALDFQAFAFAASNDVPYLTFLPSYTASAWYHKKLPADLQALPLATVLEQVERFCDGDYASALAQGDRLPPARAEEIARQLSRFTGLPAADILDHRLRINMGYFCRQLLKSQKRSMGRYDARYLGIENLAAGERPSFDPSYAAVDAPFTSTFNHYLISELGYKTDVPYYILGGGVGKWDWQRDMGYPATTDDLRSAMTRNPHMRVLIASGYYDLATPYRAVEHTLAGLGLDPGLRKNIRIEKYPAGHMMYLDPPSLRKLKSDGAAFIKAQAP